MNKHMLKIQGAAPAGIGFVGTRQARLDGSGLAINIDDGQVRVGAHFDGPLLWINPEGLGRSGGDALRQLDERVGSMRSQKRINQVRQSANSRNAIGNVANVRMPVVLVGLLERAMVGGEKIDCALA